jgi:hypothetical protein
MEFHMMLHKDFQELLSALNKQSAEYLLVGGYAVGVYSEPRATKDLDVWIRPHRENSIAVFKALAAFGAPLAGFKPDDFNDAPRSVFQMGVPPYRIEMHIHGIPVHLISPEMLVRNKLASGRPRDLLDVEDIRDATRRDSQK